MNTIVSGVYIMQINMVLTKKRMRNGGKNIKW